MRLPNLEGPPEPLLALLMGTDPESKHFLSNIRRYNTSLAMTSYRTKEEDFGGFITTFKVQGVMYHRAGSLLPMSENNAKFLQLYFTGDDDQEIRQRKGATVWDKKSKKYVRVQDDKKRIKTESGVYINASYKTNR